MARLASPHTAGIFADMAVDGPDIGTLVLIVDRAKNLPNRKTMGKQNPYCAARLGKEAKKTDTDLRGGQTPRWDQELRFRVHDSPDYLSLKISVFSEDKRTELIGEAWTSLVDIIKPGGGKGDVWQGLTFKGKYAGELRIELTYYDSRPRPERVENIEGVAAELRSSQGSGSSSRVKRRPLPGNPASGSLTPDMISIPAVPGRAKHGPRDLRTPPRANSMPTEMAPTTQPYLHAHSPDHQDYGSALPHHSSPALPLQSSLSAQYYQDHATHEEPLNYEEPEYDHAQSQMPDFLPQLPPSNRSRTQHMRLQHSHPPSLQHSHSAPSVPSAEMPNYHDNYQLRTDYPDPLPDLEYQHEQLNNRQRRSDVPPQWQNEYGDYAQEEHHESFDDGDAAPPPPPVHSNSAPVVPHVASTALQVRSSPTTPYDTTPYHARHHSVPNSSPLQHIEKTYGQPYRTPPHGHPARGGSMDDYQTPSPEQSTLHGGAPTHDHILQQNARPIAAARPLPHRNSVGGHHGMSPSPRPHPLSQEVPRPRSPVPGYAQEGSGHHSQVPIRQAGNFGREAGLRSTPTTTPQQASSHRMSTPGSGPKPRSAYSIQFPVRAFESSDGSPLSTSNLPQTASRMTPVRKSVSPQPSPTHTASPSTPFSPDSFDIHNPGALASRAQVQGNSASPHSPFAIRPVNEAHPRDSPTGPIVGWHGQEIDPSDHLPIDSWAPEPEKKTPTKTYGLGRNQGFGPRQLDGGHGRQLSKDTVVSFRSSPTGLAKLSTPPTHTSGPSSPSTGPQISPSSGRARLQKKSRPPHASPIEPLREHHNYNDVAAPIPNPYEQQDGYGRYAAASCSPGAGGGGGYHADPADALAREISSIDIDAAAGGSRRSLPAPVAYVPVRSHRDRKTFY